MGYLGSGLRLAPVAHSRNQNASPEEADRVRQLVQEILAGGTKWRNRKVSNGP